MTPGYLGVGESLGICLVANTLLSLDMRRMVTCVSDGLYRTPFALMCLVYHLYRFCQSFSTFDSKVVELHPPSIRRRACLLVAAGDIEREHFSELVVFVGFTNRAVYNTAAPFITAKTCNEITFSWRVPKDAHHSVGVVIVALALVENIVYSVPNTLEVVVSCPGFF